MYTPDPECPKCYGYGGGWWDAPVYHNETRLEWWRCDCHRGRTTVTINPGLPTESTVEVDD